MTHDPNKLGVPSASLVISTCHDDLIARLEAEAERVFDLSHLPNVDLFAEAAARVRELEADDAYVALKRNNDDLRERAERAEAERDAAMRLENVWCSAYRECDKDRDALRAENERLRALLREARLYIGVWSDDPLAPVMERIDAALKEKP